MQYYPFDSLNPLYRDKIGALAEGENLRLRLLLHNDACVHQAFLRIKRDDAPFFKEISLEAGAWVEAYRMYECDINLEEGLYWYNFRYTSDYGEFWVTKTENSLGIVSDEGTCWQQTVFTADYTTPDWLDGGIIYQIFPDRFCNSGAKKENVPQDRFICDDWQRQPEFRYDANNICRLGNDYYGGDLKGIEQKLDYLKELGVNCIYLNPIFEAHSNHRYNTADYMKIDPMLGEEKDLVSLIKKAEKKGIYIILDGVFSHTGDDSIYFNRYGRYASVGAAQSVDSPYYNWFNFTEYPHKYDSWWGISTLPETKENSPQFTEFITGEQGVIRYWLKKGIKGWRLDVADELPDEFLDNVRKAVKAEGEDKYLLGEVWEDATNKISYGGRRRFLRGKQLDSVMNYPLANAIVDFLRGRDAQSLLSTVMQIIENYPPKSVALLMNHIGTHDTARIITRLAGKQNLEGDRLRQSEARLSKEEYNHGVNLLKLAAVLQFTFPGVPSIYYGDEARHTGNGDPFCRGTYPWGNENRELIDFYKALGNLRRGCKAFASGEFIPVRADRGFMAYMRKKEESVVFVAVNRNDFWYELPLPYEVCSYETLMGTNPEWEKINLPPGGFTVIKAK